MAKFVKEAVRTNPDVLGEDLGNLALLGIGMGVTAYGNDRLVSPIVRQVIPGVGNGSNNIMAKLADAVTTGATAWALRALVGVADHSVARRLAQGGLVLAVAKAISAFIPGFALSAQLSLPSVSIPQVSAPKANGNGTANGTQTLAKLGVGSTGL